MNIDENKKILIIKEFEKIINKFSLENDSDTPDFILSEYLFECLENFGKTIKKREKWYGREVSGVSENIDKGK